MSRQAPDHHDAELVLRLYELRRDPVMRESRDTINAQFLPRSFDDVAAIAKPDHPLNRQYRQTSSYWEMVYGMAKHGIVHADYLCENNGEGLLLYARMEPHLAALRAATNPRALQNAEWLANSCDTGRAVMATFRARVQKRLAAK
jgi:hypothetical protein